MNLDAMLEALGDRARLVTGLRVYDEVPNKVTPPCLILGMGAGQWVDLDESLDVEVSGLLLTSLANASQAQRTLRGYLATTGEYSVKEKIEGDQSLAGTADAVTVRRWSEPQTYEVAGTDYLGTVLSIEVAG